MRDIYVLEGQLARKLVVSDDLNRRVALERLKLRRHCEPGQTKELTLPFDTANPDGRQLKIEGPVDVLRKDGSTPAVTYRLWFSSDDYCLIGDIRGSGAMGFGKNLLERCLNDRLGIKPWTGIEASDRLPFVKALYAEAKKRISLMEGAPEAVDGEMAAYWGHLRKVVREATHYAHAFGRYEEVTAQLESRTQVVSQEHETRALVSSSVERV